MKDYKLEIKDNEVIINYDRFRIYLSINLDENATYSIESKYHCGDEVEFSTNSLLESIIGPWYDLSWETKKEAERIIKETIKTGEELEALIDQFLNEEITNFIEDETEAVRHQGLNLYYEVLISDFSNIENAQKSLDNIYELWKEEIIELEGFDNLSKFKFENFFDLETRVFINEKLGNHIALDYKNRKVVVSSFYKAGE